MTNNSMIDLNEDIDIEDTPESDGNRVLNRFKVGKTLMEAGFGNVHVLSHDSADRALTPNRREIIETLATCNVDSQRELARILDRDPGNVKRDLDVLIEENLVKREEVGTGFQPKLKHDTIIQEPIISPAV